MMRIALALLLLSTAVVASPANARDATVKFEGVQVNCVQTDKIKFGKGAKLADCSVTKGRWFATLNFLDMYQAQYCLGKGAGNCEQSAIVVFANQAYTPNAKVILQRLDQGAAKYDDPLLIQTKYGSILTLSARFADASVTKTYYRWQSDRWVPVEARGWLRDLARQMPKGESIKAGEVWPDVDTMGAQAKLYGAGGAAADDKVAMVELAIAKDRFTMKKVTLAQK